MALPDISMRQLWKLVFISPPDPSLEPENGAVHLRLPQQYPHYRPDPVGAVANQALVAVSDVVAMGGRVLFVGTKRQAAEAIAEGARSSAQYFINHRWLGGTLTNWRTISHSIQRLKALEELLDGEHRTHQEGAAAAHARSGTSSRSRLAASRTWAHRRTFIFVIDTNKESIAIAEARKLILAVAIVDSNCDPDGISYPFRATTTPAVPSRSIAT